MMQHAFITPCFKIRSAIGITISVYGDHPHGEQGYKGVYILYKISSFVSVFSLRMFSVGRDMYEKLLRHNQ